ncbi:MAG: hypothetical protein IJX27_02910 [Clostridia bacterium]|nr:hypothetical protein [Clostridia bacterium]
MNNPIKLRARRRTLETRYKNARSSLLAIIAFTVINIILLVSKNYTYFLFSAAVPYYFADMGMFYTGMYPDGYYFLWTGEFYDASVLVFMLSLSALVLLFYFLFWLMSEKGKYGWLIAALAFFGIDTLFLLFSFGGLAAIPDICFHAFVIVELAMGVHACTALEKMPAAEEIAAMEYSLPRFAESDEKERIFIKTTAWGKEITYRRSRGANELVVDGLVYDELWGFVEKAHKLCATLDGHEIEVGFDGRFTSYAMLDGEITEQKKRFF